MEDSSKFRFFSNKRKPEPNNTVTDAVPWGMQVAAAWSWRILVVAGVLVVFGYLLIELRYLVIPFMIAILLAGLLIPVVDWLVRRRLPRWLAVLVTEVGVIALVIGLLALVVWQLISGFASGFREKMTELFDGIVTWVVSLPLGISEDKIDEYLAHLVKLIEQDFSTVWSGALSVGSSVGHTLTGVILALFTLIFVLYDGRGIWAWIVGIFPKRARLALDGGGNAAWLTLTNFTKVQVLVAVIDAIGIGVGAAILQVPFAIPIAVLVFIGSFIPIVGAIFTGAIAVFIALVYHGWISALIMLGVVLLVQQVESHILQPLIMGTAVKIHPLAVVLAVAGGTMVAGIPGALFAVPLVAMLNAAIHYIASGKWRVQAQPTLEDVITSD